MVTATGSTPTGSVAFLDGTTTLQTVNLDSSGKASFSTSTLSVGAHNITAKYNPTGTFVTSTLVGHRRDDQLSRASLPPQRDRRVRLGDRQVVSCATS